MRESASTDPWEPQGSNPLGPPGPELVSKAEGAGRVCQLPRGFRERDRDLAGRPGARNFSPGRGLPRGRLAVRRVAAALRAIAGSSPRLARMGTSGACRSDLVHDATPEARSFTPRRFLPMFVPFRRYFSERKTQDVAARAAGSVAHRLNRRRPTLESLETRNLLSFIGSEHQVSLDPTSSSGHGQRQLQQRDVGGRLEQAVSSTDRRHLGPAVRPVRQSDRRADPGRLLGVRPLGQARMCPWTAPGDSWSSGRTSMRTGPLTS